VPLLGQSCLSNSLPAVDPLHNGHLLRTWVPVRGGRATKPCNRCPPFPRTSFAQFATVLQPVKTLSPGELVRTVADWAFFTNGIGVCWIASAHNLSTKFFADEALRRAENGRSDAIGEVTLMCFARLKSLRPTLGRRSRGTDAPGISEAGGQSEPTPCFPGRPCAPDEGPHHRPGRAGGPSANATCWAATSRGAARFRR
jgi:hypothetical protein